jgi:hypothetical protein
MAELTVQIPFEAQSVLPQPPPPASAGGRPVIGVGLTSQSPTDTSTPPMSIGVLSDQIHILTSCDPFISTAPYAPLPTGFPCPQIVAHADGSTVSVANPAKAGEELVAYAVGLGQTNPASVTGQLVTQSAPTLTTFTLDFNFHPNALGSRPLPNGPQPDYAGTTPGYVGLYQVNFTLPPVPAGTPPCVDASKLPQGSNVVQSNLTVSIGGQYSFDGARICVSTQ